MSSSISIPGNDTVLDEQSEVCHVHDVRMEEVFDLRSPDISSLSNQNDVSLDSSENLLITPIVAYRQNFNNNIIFAHVNINSIRYKFKMIQEMLSQKLADFLTIAETKLDQSFTSSIFSVTDYALHRQDRDGRGGGIMTYVHKNIPHRRRKELEVNTAGFESLCIECHIKREKWCIISLYKPPGTHDDLFTRCFKQITESVLCEYEIIVLLGDFNFNMLKPNILHQLCDAYGLSNLIKEATCFKNPAGSLLDVFLTNVKSRFYRALNVDYAESDFHHLIGVASRVYAPKSSKKIIHYRSYKKFDLSVYQSDVKKFVSSTHLHLNCLQNGNDMYDRFYKGLTEIIQKHAPIKQKEIKMNYVPYMNSQLRKAIFKKRMLHNSSKYYAKGSNEHHMYRKACNNVVKLKRKSENNYFKERCSGGPKNQKFWDTIKPYMKETSALKNDHIELLENGTIVTDEIQVVNILNTYFAKSGNVNNITDTVIFPIESTISQHKQHPSISRIQGNYRNPASEPFNFKPVSAKDIQLHMNKLDIKKATGFDNLPAKLLKYATEQLAPYLSELINKCIDSSIFPSNLKRADIVPIFKKTDRLNKTFYRPVSILPVISKLFERVIEKQLSLFFEHFFNIHVSGFRKQHSCQHVLLNMTEKW